MKGGIMQEEINHKTIALSINTSKMTAQTLKTALRMFMKGTGVVIRKQTQKAYAGKQSMKKLMKQNTGLSNVEITDANIGSFKRVARKYGIDFALKKDKTAETPTYIVYFKGRDVDVMTQAFKEYSHQQVNKHEKPSVIAKLQENKVEVEHDLVGSIDKVLGKNKSQELTR